VFQLGDLVLDSFHSCVELCCGEGRVVLVKAVHGGVGCGVGVVERGAGGRGAGGSCDRIRYQVS
jgi:hypothetical protein